MHLSTYLTILGAAERTLAASDRHAATGHPEEPEVAYPCAAFARQCTAWLRMRMKAAAPQTLLVAT